MLVLKKHLLDLPKMDLFNTKTTPQLPINLPTKEGYSYRYDAVAKVFRITVPNGEIIYAADFFDKKISDRSMDYFFENKNGLDWKTTDWRAFEKEKLASVEFVNIHWQHDQIKMFGKTIFLPRYSAWHGASNKVYTYSGLTLYSKAWNKGLLYLKQQIDSLAAVNFNSVLLNWYRDGLDHMSWHADDEKELGKNPVIGSVNFGATRRFLIRRIADKTEKIEFPLKHGTLLVMKGALQHYWQHAVPKERKVKADRVNLTFREIHS